jgi:hypothetical protein
MNDLQLFYYYQTIPLTTIHKNTWIYPKYVVITGRSIFHPHPHRHYNFEEFLDKLYSDSEFKKKLLL